MKRLALSAVGVRSQLALHHRRVSAHLLRRSQEKYLFAMANLLRWHPKDAIRRRELKRRFHIYRQPGRSVKTAKLTCGTSGKAALMAREVHTCSPASDENLVHALQSPAPAFRQTPGFIELNINHLIAPFRAFKLLRV